MNLPDEIGRFFRWGAIMKTDHTVIWYKVIMKLVSDDEIKATAKEKMI